MNNLIIYKVYHHTDLLKEYPFNNDGLRYFINTQNNEYGQYFNEYCALIDNYDNIKYGNIEYIGLEHYRRTFDQITIDNYQKYIDIIKDKKECIIYNICMDYYQKPYLIFLCEKIHDDIYDYLINNNYIKEANYINKFSLLIRKEMFIMHKQYCVEMIDFINNCINYVFHKYNINNTNDICKFIDDLKIEYLYYDGDKYRLFGYVIEYLISIWIQTNMKNFYQIDKINI